METEVFGNQIPALKTDIHDDIVTTYRLIASSHKTKSSEQV